MVLMSEQPFSMLIVEIYKSIVHCIEYFLLSYDVLKL